jgi:hypothetical protein
VAARLDPLGDHRVGPGRDGGPRLGRGPGLHEHQAPRRVRAPHQTAVDAPRERDDLDALLGHDVEPLLLVEGEDEVDAERPVGGTAHLPDLLA